MHLVRPEPVYEYKTPSAGHCSLNKKGDLPLRAGALRKRGLKSHAEAQEARLRYHDAVVDAEPADRSERKWQDATVREQHSRE